MDKRAERRIIDKKVIKKRLKLLKNLPSANHPDSSGKTYAERMEEEPGRLRDKHPLDCGKAKCQICHSDKIFKKKKLKQKLEDVEFKEEQELPGDFVETDFH